MGIAGLGDATADNPLTAGMLRRHQAQMRYRLTRHPMSSISTTKPLELTLILSMPRNPDEKFDILGRPCWLATTRSQHVARRGLPPGDRPSAFYKANLLSRREGGIGWKPTKTPRKTCPPRKTCRI